MQLKNELSATDKFKVLFKNPQKLLLCHATELERINLTNRNHLRDYHMSFVESLYKHYIVKKLTKKQLINQ
jgi:hypothetical protein